MGYFYFTEKRFDKALQLSLDVVRQKPDHVKAQYQLAQTYFRLKERRRAQEALAIYTKLQELERQQRKGLYNVSKAGLRSIPASE
jgi:tetratricopeptide (TPR) repeat protein